MTNGKINCHSVFKDSRSEPTKAQFTQLWITLVDQMESSKRMSKGGQ